jgi:hypothetical protein
MNTNESSISDHDSGLFLFWSNVCFVSLAENANDNRKACEKLLGMLFCPKHWHILSDLMRRQAHIGQYLCTTDRFRGVFGHVEREKTNKLSVLQVFQLKLSQGDSL